MQKYYLKTEQELINKIVTLCSNTYRILCELTNVRCDVLAHIANGEYLNYQIIINKI